MNAKQFMRLFGINPKIMCDRDDATRWINVVAQYHEFPYERVKDELFKLVKEVGKEKPRFYYVEAVRRRIIDQNHQETKKAPIPSQMKEIMKGMFK